MTLDSSVSATESRVGGFDVHHDDGNSTANPETKAAPPPINYPKSTGDTIKLRKLNAEVAVARQRQAQLAAQKLSTFMDQLAVILNSNFSFIVSLHVFYMVFLFFFQSSMGHETIAKSASWLRYCILVLKSQNSHLLVVFLRFMDQNVLPQRSFIWDPSGDSIYDEEPVKISEIAERQLNNGNTVSTVGNVNIVVPELEIVQGFSKNRQIRKVIIGGHQAPTDEDKELREAGAFRLDVISIVLSHNERALGWPFINELAAVKHMLGDDLKTNVLPIITNSEVLPQPVAVRSLALANISFVEYYKCNNLGFMPNVTEIPKLQHNLFFSHGMASLEAYFRDLQELIHPLLAILRGAKRSPSNYSYSDTNLY
ncbi:hypothetical protein NECAME_05016 [Necator americanus]|uniref:Uncharacterized protein n=1 Tax=Necator americanus TaxID=51031 RepID=W2SKP9_NECAM|nr:hypothetical protein NECAME_05016 [Necator americanus]ETN70195.1 hypothetical protein NECAME_05016 [Necator americanus]